MTPNKSMKDAKKEMIRHMKTKNAQKDHATLGVIRLDYNYPAAPGDIDCPETFDYDVFYSVVPKYTFEMCQGRDLTLQCEKNLNETIDYLVNTKKVSGITGDCGFMMYIQRYVREHQKTHCPVFMSALCQLPAVTCAFGKDEQIAILTANGETLKPMHRLIARECGVHIEEDRYVIYGAEKVPGFEAVALGEKVNVQEVTPGIVKLAK